jgi:hypothetical protein
VERGEEGEAASLGGETACKLDIGPRLYGPPTRGKLVALDPALLVTPPSGLEVGYVPIVTRQTLAEYIGVGRSQPQSIKNQFPIIPFVLIT